MSTLTNWFRLLLCREAVLVRTQTFTCVSSRRTFADKPDANSKQVMMHGTENEERMRVRRARPGDVPRVMRFVREHARSAWPGLAAPPSSQQLMLCDYVARALAQGHSMLAEQQEARRGRNHIRGLALSVAVCPWDAAMLDKWSRCMRCARSRRLMAFTAHCLRAPSLHEKYNIHNILQVILIVPQDNNSNSAEVISILAKNAIKRGNENGFPLIRFDVTCDNMAKCLEELDLKKEWELSYDLVPEPMKDNEEQKTPVRPLADDTEKKPIDIKTQSGPYKHHITVYTAKTSAEKEK